MFGCSNTAGSLPYSIKLLEATCFELALVLTLNPKG